MLNNIKALIESRTVSYIYYTEGHNLMHKFKIIVVIKINNNNQSALQ